MSDIDNNGQQADQGEQAETTRIDPADMPEAERLADIPNDSIGRRIDALISPRSFVSMEEAQAMVAGKPRGWNMPIGRIIGYAKRGERRDSKAPVKPGADPLPPSYFINGTFECTSLMDGTIRTAPWLILPRAAGDMMETAFNSGGAERVLLDIELGIEATGRAIPYTYTVTAYGTRETADQKALSALRARQEARQAQRQQAQLNAPDPAQQPLPIDMAAESDRAFAQPHRGHKTE